MTKGRPPGPSHKMKREQFIGLFLEQLALCETVAEAYERAEEVVINEYGYRRFRSYHSFRQTKFILRKKRLLLKKL